jgi:hypothetical protein
VKTCVQKRRHPLVDPDASGLHAPICVVLIMVLFARLRCERIGLFWRYHQPDALGCLKLASELTRSMDLKALIDAVMHGTPFAILAACVGVVWQAAYAFFRDRIHDKQSQREMTLELQKFEYQKKLEDLKFAYEQERWREQLARELTTKLVDARLDEYSKVWSHVQGVAKGQPLTIEAAKAIAGNVKDWRYSKGGLLAEETTRSAAMAFQTALWDFDGSGASYHRVRSGRRIFRDAIRADMGLTGDIFQRAEARFQKVRQDLIKLQSELGIEHTNDGG